MKRILASLPLSTIAIFLVACSTLSNQSALYKVVADAYLGDFDDAGPGVVMLTARDGAVTFYANRGLADLENPVPLSADSVVRIASLTKQFTAVAILALVEDGLLGLDDPLGDRLDECPGTWAGITIAQLLSHTSGLSGDMGLVLQRLRDDFTPRELLHLFSDQPPTSVPGEQWRYSNLNYWILGVVIEELTGQGYAQFIKQRVLQPAGLKHTRYGDRAPVIRGRAEGYVRTPQGAVQNAPYFSSTIGFSAGGYVSTPRELAEWYATLSRGEIISEAMIRRALTPILLEDGSNSGFGLGWYLDHVAGERIAHHGGSSIGFSSYVYWRPEHAVFSAIFTNDGSLPEPNSAAKRLFLLAQSEGD